YTFHIRLPTKFSFGTDFARHAGHFRGERAELVHHRIDDVLDLENFTTRFHRDLLGQVTVRNGRRNLRNVTELNRQVRCHEVHVVREILPHTGHTFDLRLATELAFRTDLARHTAH